MKRFFIVCIRLYQRYISPLRPPCCRFTPTCSHYAIQAIEKHGALKGGWLSLRRVCCCHPFYRGRRGPYDPVP